MRIFKRLQRTLAAVLCGAVAASAFGLNAFAAELNVQYTYSQNGYTFEKISHASSPTETKDGIIDYLGNHDLEPYVDGVSDPANADSVQSYIYCQATHGDWVYFGTMYGALSAYNQARRGLTSMGVSTDVADAVVDTIYNGKLNTGAEDDGYYAGSIFAKFNAVTGETKILMSREMYENGECNGVPIFRSACTYNDKLYFVGLVSNGTAMDKYNGYPLSQAAALNLEIQMQAGVPSIYELDPETDTLTKVYECVDVAGYRKLNDQNVFTSTRAIGTFTDPTGHEYLIAGGLVDGSDGENPLGVTIYATDDPASGEFNVIANQNDLFDYPAVNRADSQGGGGLYQVVQFGDALYAAIVSGRYNADPALDTKERAFAIVRGTYDASKGSANDREAWTWTPLVGDLADGAKYTFGIDPARTACGACTLQVYDGYLYIGEYNDVNGSLQAILNTAAPSFHVLAKNLSQSINLYRMDADENVEMVVGDPTEMFPKSLSGLGSGYESSHLMQYTWMTTVFDGTMYLSSMDQNSLLRPAAMFLNADMLPQGREEWKSQIGYVKTLINKMKNEETNGTSRLLPSLVRMNRSFDAMNALLDTNDFESFAAEYENALNISERIRGILPENMRPVLDLLLNVATLENFRDLLTCAKYLSGSEPGFDLYAITANDEGGVDITTVTTNGFGDRYNHGLRVFANTDDYMVIGTANPFMGAQFWRMSASPTKTYGHNVHHYELTQHVEEDDADDSHDIYECGECDDSVTRDCE